MVGLAVLSLIISQLHRVIALFESGTNRGRVATVQIQPDLAAAETNILEDMETAARIYRPLTKELGEKFKLRRLYQLFAQEQIAHPHITIRSLRESGYLIPVGDDFFSWKTE